MTMAGNLQKIGARKFAKRITLLLLGVTCLSLNTVVAKKTLPATREGENPAKMEKFIDDLLKKMTLEEKVGQMNQVLADYGENGPLNVNSEQGKDIRAGRIGSIFNVAGVENARKLQQLAVENSRLHIPLIFGFDAIHGMKTIFPIPLGEAASWDLESIERSARITAVEASAMGVHWTFSPMVDIARDARWGRIAEGAGEDPYLGSLIAKARVKGFQGDDLHKNNTIAACAKHYAAYGAAIAGRDYNAVDMSEVTLRDVYLPPFKAAVDAGAATLMSSFNTLNGVPATANEFLLRDILKKEWGFDGFVVSDFESVKELVAHGYAADGADAARLAANAGLDMEMKSELFRKELAKLVEKGVVSEKVLDEAVRRILRIKYKLGLFDDPYRYCNDKREKTELLTPEHVAAARDAARKSVVLLKNTNNLLPLKKNIGTLVVIGAMADSQSDMFGCWGGVGEAKDAVSILQGIKAAVLPQTKVLYAKGCEINAKEPEDFSTALSVAKQADAIVMTMGELASMSGEAQARSNINIPGNQEALLRELLKLEKPVVVLLTNGRPLAIPWVATNVPAIVETWFLGSQAGNAIADVLFGDYSPSGKLTVSFPQVVGQEPFFYNQLSTGRPLAENPDDMFRSRYNDVSNDAVFPFGFGLSYTTFEYSNLRLSQNVLAKGGKIQVSVDVKNTGSRLGEEVVQMYIRNYCASVCQPIRLLKGFKKLAIEPGQAQTVTFTLTPEDLKYHNSKMVWTVEPGKFGVFVGGDSQHTMNKEFTLK